MIKDDKPTLEDLLNKRDYYLDKVVTQADIHPEDSEILTHEGNASLFDFMKMIQSIVRKTMYDIQAEFIPEEGFVPIVDAEHNIEHPIITYSVIQRIPQSEYKPRIRQFVNENTDDEEEARSGYVAGQKFESIVQFNVFTSVYGNSDEVMERFEEMIYSYTYFFKKNGVGEIIFSKQLTDSNLDSYRQTMSIRSLRYLVVTEKLYQAFRNKITETNIV